MQDKDKQETLLFDLHTLKGTSATLGFGSVAHATHQLEGLLKEFSNEDDASSRQAISQGLARLSKECASLEALYRLRLRSFFTSPTYELKTISADELIGISESTDQLKEQLLERFLASAYTRVSDIVDGLSAEVGILAAKLGKAEPLIEVSDDSKFLIRNGYSTQLEGYLIHLLRNAIDHGLEPPEERIKSGKTPTGSIWISPFVEQGRFGIEIEDDGRGLDLNKIASIDESRRAPIVGATSIDVAKVIFESGFSTKDQASVVSGRGLGLSGTRRALEQEGGNLSVVLIEPNDHQATVRCKFRLLFPARTTIAIGLLASENKTAVPQANLPWRISRKFEQTGPCP